MTSPEKVISFPVSAEKIINFHYFCGEFRKLSSPKLESEMVCPGCGGTKGHTWPVDPKNRSELMWFCGNGPCLQADKKKNVSYQKQDRATRWIDFCKANEIGDVFYDLSMEQIQQPSNIQKCLLDFAEKPKGVIILEGEIGTGKTYASLSVAEFFTRTRSDASFFFCSSLAEQWSNRFGDEDPKYRDKLIRRVKENTLLIIDDFAQVTPKAGFMSFLFEIINQRLQWSDKGTILTTNCSKKKIAEICGEALFDRLKGQKWIKTSGQSRR